MSGFIMRMGSIRIRWDLSRNQHQRFEVQLDKFQVDLLPCNLDLIIRFHTRHDIKFPINRVIDTFNPIGTLHIQ